MDWLSPQHYKHILSSKDNVDINVVKTRTLISLTFAIRETKMIFSTLIAFVSSKGVVLTSTLSTCGVTVLANRPLFITSTI